MNADDIHLVALDGPRVASNGAIKRRLALRIGEEDKDVVTLRLDSDLARTRQAGRWAEAFGLDKTMIEAKLREAAIAATAEIQERRASESARGAKPPPATPCTLDDARPAFEKWLVGLDRDLLDVVFGVLMAHRLDGDPVWLFVVGAPGDGKTEILRSLSAHDDVYVLSSLTPGALISGYITEGEDPSLLPKLDGKVLVVKDFTAVLTMREESRSEILGTLRDCYDGQAAKAFGTGETRTYQSRFGFLAAVTPVVDRYWSVSAQLGERFLKYRLVSGEHEVKVRRALKNTNEETAMRDELSAASLGVLAQTSPMPILPDEIEDRLVSLAEFVARARSEVARDRDGVIQFVPAVEVGTRVSKALKKLGLGIAMARGVKVIDEDVYRIVRRVAEDTVPSMRSRLLRVLWGLRASAHKTAAVAEIAEIPTDTANVWLNDLRLLGIAERGGDQHAGYTWLLREQFQQTVVAAGLWCDRGVPPGIAPQTPLALSKTGSGVQNPPPPPTHNTDETFDFGHNAKV